MILRSPQPKIARHVVEVPFTNFGYLVLALYDVEDGISRGLWFNFFLVDTKGKKPSGEHILVDVGAITSISQRSSKHHQPIPQLIWTYPSYPLHQYRPRAFPQSYD